MTQELMKNFLKFLKWSAVIFASMTLLFVLVSFAAKLIYQDWAESNPDQVNPAGRLPSTR